MSAQTFEFYFGQASFSGFAAADVARAQGENNTTDGEVAKEDIQPGELGFRRVFLCQKVMQAILKISPQLRLIFSIVNKISNVPCFIDKE